MRPLRTTLPTIRAYERHQEVYLREWNRKQYSIPPLLISLAELLSRNSRILDMGCGPGQDCRYLRRQGFWVVGLDRTMPFLSAARIRSPRLPLIQADFRHLPFPPRTFSGIWAAASLIHLSKSAFPKVLRTLHTLSVPGAVLGVTVMHGIGSGIPKKQWIPGRFLSKWHKKELEPVIRRGGWIILSLQCVANQERKGRWLNLLAVRST